MELCQVKQSTPLGKISLEVFFGSASNFRKEPLDFEVVDWKSQYPVILERPAFACFMAVPHYAYLKLKMPGPRGVITVSGSFIRSDRCDREFHKISETFGAHQASRAATQGEEALPKKKKEQPEDSQASHNKEPCRRYSNFQFLGLPSHQSK